MHLLRLPSASPSRRSWFGRLRARHEADRLLRVSEGRWEAHPAFAWRAAELTSERERRVLARSLRGVVENVTSPGPVPSASPVNRRGLFPYAKSIEVLAERLADLDRPVTAAGVVLTRDLLTDGGSPLYLGGNAPDLPRAISKILATLEAH